MIEPTTDAAFINGVLNHPEVRPWIADMGEGVIDVTDQISLPNVLVLRGESGCFVLFKLDSGIWECHTAILPEGRGPKARAFARAGAEWLFTHSDCIELLTRVPATHLSARRLTLDAGFRLQFTTLPETRFRGELVPVEVYSLSLQDWANAASGMEERGRAFHAWLNTQVGRVHGEPHTDDPAHNRAVGTAIAMMAGGQLGKGVVWYNRWAVEARHPLISLVGVNPPQIRFDAGILTMAENGTISYSPCH